MHRRGLQGMAATAVGSTLARPMFRAVRFSHVAVARNARGLLRQGASAVVHRRVFRKVRFQAPLNLVSPIRSGTMHPTLRPRSNISQLLALRAAVLRRAVRQLILKHCDASDSSLLIEALSVALSS